MSDKKQPIKQAVKEYYADKSLSDSQLGALQETIKRQADSFEKNHINIKKTSVFKWGGSIAASLFLFVLMAGYLQTPDLISSAYADIRKDAHLSNGMQASMQQWLDENNIASVPRQYPVKMSKFCRLDQVLTTHLRIAGKEQGEVNVFIHHGERPLSWFDGSGAVEDMNWKLLKVRNNLTLIVLYTHDMREKSVQHILHEMLPELGV